MMRCPSRPWFFPLRPPGAAYVWRLLRRSPVLMVILVVVGYSRLGPGGGVPSVSPTVRTWTPAQSECEQEMTGDNDTNTRLGS